jgi:hypothetical protein
MKKVRVVSSKPLSILWRLCESKTTHIIYQGDIIDSTLTFAEIKIKNGDTLVLLPENEVKIEVQII